ncbi:MAG: hypothetical protein GY909_17580 [Oligoflexia bacterium]|nr:hypothetical protein [Oligoflexia bacterium]
MDDQFNDKLKKLLDGTKELLENLNNIDIDKEEVFEDTIVHSIVLYNSVIKNKLYIYSKPFYKNFFIKDEFNVFVKKTLNSEADLLINECKRLNNLFTTKKETFKDELKNKIVFNQYLDRRTINANIELKLNAEGERNNRIFKDGFLYLSFQNTSNGVIFSSSIEGDIKKSAIKKFFESKSIFLDSLKEALSDDPKFKLMLHMIKESSDLIKGLI